MKPGLIEGSHKREFIELKEIRENYENNKKNNIGSADDYGYTLF